MVQLSVRWVTTRLSYYDNNGLESRSDGDCPYGQNLSLRLFCYDIAGLRLLTGGRSSLCYDDQLPG